MLAQSFLGQGEEVGADPVGQLVELRPDAAVAEEECARAEERFPPAHERGERSGRGVREDLHRVAQRMRRRVRPEQLISSSIFGLARHAALAAVYFGLAYAAKLAFGVSLTLTAMR